VTAVRGPDVSSYQGRPDWQRVKRAGFLFAACKATEGLTYNDPTFARNWAGIKNAGLVRIAYHFAHADRGRSPIAEARHFLDVVRDRGGTADGIPALDIEAGNLSGQNFRAWVNAWCAEIQKHWRAGLIYTGGWFWNPHGGGNPPKDWKLWVSGYTSSPPRVDGFGSWSFWQFTDGRYGPQPHSVPGIGQCDISVFNGSPAALRAFAGGRSPNPGQRDLKSGDQGEDVAALQHDLNHRLVAHRFHAIKADGSYGPSTEQAVHRVKYLLGFPRSQVKRLGATKRAQQFIHDPDKRPKQYVQTAEKRKKS
jgi:lysozyme